jgi:hypothetical protein
MWLGSHSHEGGNDTPPRDGNFTTESLVSSPFIKGIRPLQYDFNYLTYLMTRPKKICIYIVAHIEQPTLNILIFIKNSYLLKQVAYNNG